MSARRPRRVIAAAAFLLACGPSAAPPAFPLQPEDFTLRGVPLNADSAEIRLTFGDPDSIATSDSPFGSDTLLVTWIYEGFEARFSGEGPAAGYLIRSPGESTARGLSVGDPASSVRPLYGDPTTGVDDGWTYLFTPADDTDLRVIDLLISGDTVRRIYIGRAVQ